MKTKLFTIIFCSLLFTIFPLQSLYSQEISATVDLVTEGLSSDQLIQVDALKETLERYINNQVFWETNWEGPKIPVNIAIQVSGAGINNYSANLFIIAKRTLPGEDEAASTSMMFEDNGNWNFEFSNGVSLTFDYNRYDNIASLIDFYMLIIIGLDLDSYGELDGDQCFQRAKRVFDNAVAHNANGWASYSTDYGKHTLINDLSIPRLDEFRKLIFAYYVDGLDILAENRETALANICDVIHRMGDFKERYFTLSHFMDAFFFTKCQEICELLRGYTKDAKVFRDLLFLDPTNTVRYEAARDSK